MAIQTINIGNQVNDGLGDDLRTAFQKVNANFSALDAELGISGANVGTTGTGIFKQKNGAVFEFKNLTNGRHIALTEFNDNISIASTAPDAFIRIDTNAGVLTANTGNGGNITIQGGADIDVVTDGASVITVQTIVPVTSILTTYDFGHIVGTFNNSVQFALAWTNVDFGTITLPSSIDLDCGTLS